jgi:hypothetical protein
MTSPDGRSTITEGATEPTFEVVTLIPGEDYLVFVNPGPDDLPDEVTIQELRIQAYQRRNKATLGASDLAVEMVRTLVDYAAAGIVGAVALAPFHATGRYIKQWRAKRRPTANRTHVESIAYAAVDKVPLPTGKPTTASIDRAEDSGWHLVLISDGTPIRVTVDPSASAVSVIVGEPNEGSTDVELLADDL